jgi:ABC-type uncharacterized transport system involved in gliding motility auxiliary subunit
VKISKHDVFKNLAWLGATLLVAGGLRYLIQEAMLTASRVMLIAGAALFAIGCAGNFRSIAGYFTRRSTRMGSNTLVLAVSVLAILVAGNILATKHPKRWDMTEEGLHSLSDQTIKIVSGLKSDVTVIKFDQQEDRRLSELMAEYKALSGRIRYQFVNPQEKPEMAKQYAVQRYGETILTSGARTERVTESNEQEITNALLKLTRDSTKTVCFSEGHAEKSPSSSDEDGYSGVDAGLKRENYGVKSVNLVAQNGVPSDCTMFVIAGPKKAFFPQEVEMVKKHLEGGGKAMLLLDPDVDAGFGDVLKEWKIEVGKDTVVDASGVGRLFGIGPAAPLVVQYGSHPVTKGFEGSMTFFPLVRSVKTAKSEPAGIDQPTEILKTSEQSWAETELSGGRAKFDEGKDTMGPISLGVAASKKTGEKEARLLVIGDSDFATNRWNLQQTVNGDLFQNSVNWLAQDEDLISVRPKSPKGRRVTLTQSQQNMMKWIGYVALPVAVLLTGAVVWWRRR